MVVGVSARRVRCNAFPMPMCASLGKCNDHAGALPDEVASVRANAIPTHYSSSCQNSQGMAVAPEHVILICTIRQMDVMMLGT
jgi:hypothetical protein